MAMNSLEPWNAWASWTDTSKLHIWSSKIDHIRGTVLSLIDLITDLSMKEDASIRWSKIEFFYAYCRDIGQPLELGISDLKAHIDRLRVGSLISEDTLKALI
jgi:hypothetical protein